MKVATIACCWITENFAKNKPFKGSEVNGESLSVADSSLINAFKNETQIFSKIKDVQLSRSIVARSVEYM
jgi:hypothetical protein